MVVISMENVCHAKRLEIGRISSDDARRTSEAYVRAYRGRVALFEHRNGRAGSAKIPEDSRAKRSFQSPGTRWVGSNEKGLVVISLEHVLQIIANALDKRQIPYAVMGGLAVRIYAIPRFTSDVDLTISLEREELPALFELLESIGCEVPSPFREGWLDTVAGLPLFKAEFRENGRSIEIDIFVSETDFQGSLMDRRQRIETPVGWISFVSPEDLILLKLLASRPRDLIDVQDILFTLGRLDFHYLKHWAQVLSISEALHATLAQHRQECSDDL